ncbi:hypothetical protein L7F22_036979 [Adiantum nelumboides]|nr:hypothetical protein [Adiantum nelumboides]
MREAMEGFDGEDGERVGSRTPARSVWGLPSSHLPFQLRVSMLWRCAVLLTYECKETPREVDPTAQLDLSLVSHRKDNFTTAHSHSYAPIAFGACRNHAGHCCFLQWKGFARASRLLTVELKGVSHHFPLVETDLTEYMHIVKRASSFVKEKLFYEGTRRLDRSFWKGPSMAPSLLDDYAFLIASLLDLFEAGGQTEWLIWAIQLQETQNTATSRIHKSPITQRALHRGSSVLDSRDRIPRA